MAITCSGLEDGAPLWTNGLRFVSVVYGGASAWFCQGEGSEPALEIVNEEYIEFDCEIDMSHVDHVACHDLADWLACDHLDNDGYPAFAEGYVGFYEARRRIEACAFS